MEVRLLFLGAYFPHNLYGHINVSEYAHNLLVTATLWGAVHLGIADTRVRASVAGGTAR